MPLAIRDDKISFTPSFADGPSAPSTTANGHRSFPKERLEVFGGPHVGLTIFRRLTGWDGRIPKMNLGRG